METNESDSTQSHDQDISSTTKKIVNEIKTLEKELMEIQDRCPHPKYTIKNSQGTKDSGFCLRRICDECQAVVGYPSPEEINQWTKS